MQLLLIDVIEELHHHFDSCCSGVDAWDMSEVSQIMYTFVYELQCCTHCICEPELAHIHDSYCKHDITTSEFWTWSAWHAVKYIRTLVYIQDCFEDMLPCIATRKIWGHVSKSVRRPIAQIAFMKCFTGLSFHLWQKRWYAHVNAL